MVRKAGDSPKWSRMRRAKIVHGALNAFTTLREEAALRAALQTVPAGASVAAPPGLLAHLAERPRILSPPEYDDGRPVDVRLTLQP